MKKILVVLLFTGILGLLGVTAQTLDSRERLEQILDGVVFEVPGYGIMEFEFSQRLYNATAIRKGSDTWLEEEQVPFEVNIRRLDEKKFDRDDYMVTFTVKPILSEEVGSLVNKSPNDRYHIDFYVLRDIIYPVKDFPYMYVLFADGELYYAKYKFESYTLEQVKERKLKGEDVSGIVGLEYVHCPRVKK